MYLAWLVLSQGLEGGALVCVQVADCVALRKPAQIAATQSCATLGGAHCFSKPTLVHACFPCP